MVFDEKYTISSNYTKKYRKEAQKNDKTTTFLVFSRNHCMFQIENSSFRKRLIPNSLDTRKSIEISCFFITISVNVEQIFKLQQAYFTYIPTYICLYETGASNSSY